MIREHARTDAGPDQDLPFVHDERLRENIDQLLAGSENPLGRRRIFVHGGELIAAQAAGEAEIQHRLLEPPRNTRQYLIAEGVAQAVVEILEIVDIDEEHAHVTPILHGAPQRMVEQNEQMSAVGKMCQRIMLGKMLQLPSALFDLFLEPLLVIAGHVSSRGEFGGHAVETGPQGVEFLDPAARDPHVHLAARDFSAWRAASG